MSTEKNIYQRLNEVRKKVGYLQKDAQVQGYKAITHDAVTSATRKPFIEHGVFVIPEQTGSVLSEVGETKNGTSIIRYEAWYKFHFVNMDDPDDCILVVVESHAMDTGDKAPGKALSYADKYAKLKVLNIETGETDESRIEMANNKKPVFTPNSDGWEKAVKAWSKGKINAEFMTNKYRISEEHLEQLKAEGDSYAE